MGRRCYDGIAMSTSISTTAVCRALELSEPALRHVLRRPGAPRPAVHPTARLFLWTEDDIRRLAEFLGKPSPEGARQEG